MDELEKIKWYLVELANADSESIESDEIEIYGEDAQGREGSFTMNITTIAENALEQIVKLEKVVEAAKLLDKLKLIKDVRGKTEYYKENKPKAWLNLSETLSELARTPPIKNED